MTSNFNAIRGIWDRVVIGNAFAAAWRGTGGHVRVWHAPQALVLRAPRARITGTMTLSTDTSVRVRVVTGQALAERRSCTD
jgi:hypothetical protein